MFFVNHVQRLNKSLTFVSLFFVLISALYLSLVGIADVQIWWKGAQDIDLERLGMPNLEGLIVRVDSKGFHKIGEQILTIKGEERISSKYFLLFTESNFLLVRAATKFNQKTFFEGSLKKIPKHLEDELLAPLLDEGLIFRGNNVVSYYIDEESKGGGYALLSLCVFCVFLVYLLKFIPSALIFIGLGTSRSISALEGYGKIEDMIKHIDDRMEAKKFLKIGRVFLIDKLAFAKINFKIKIFSYSEIVWIYKKTKVFRFFYVPIFWYHSLVIITSSGATIRIKGSDQNCEDLIVELAKRAPWTHIGYDSEWKKKMRKRHRMVTIAEVNRRRDEILSAI